MKNITKKITRVWKRKNFLIITDILIGWGSAIGTSTMSLKNPTIGMVLTISSAPLTSMAFFKINEYISKLKIRYILN